MLNIRLVGVVPPRVLSGQRYGVYCILNRSHICCHVVAGGIVRRVCDDDNFIGIDLRQTNIGRANVRTERQSDNNANKNDLVFGNITTSYREHSRLWKKAGVSARFFQLINRLIYGL
jgi:hypothetical protein